MSGKGNFFDNTSVETFFKSLKAELIWRQSWSTRRQAEVAIFQYINGFFNARRRHSYLCSKSPLTSLRLDDRYKSNKPLDKITVLDLERWRAGEVERGLSNQTINRDISSIKASFNRAVDRRILPVNPLAKIKKARVDDCLKVRYLSEAEEYRLRYAHLAPEFKLKAVEVLVLAREAAMGGNKFLALVR